MYYLGRVTMTAVPAPQGLGRRYQEHAQVHLVIILLGGPNYAEYMGAYRYYNSILIKQ